MQEALLIDQFLPIELTNGNDGRGSRWFRTAKVRKDLEAIIRMLGLSRTPFSHPVRIELTRILGKKQRLWDADSIGRGNSKELIDALVSCGWFHDDGPKWVTACDYRQDSSNRKIGPAVRIRVFREDTDAEPDGLSDAIHSLIIAVPETTSEPPADIVSALLALIDEICFEDDQQDDLFDKWRETAAESWCKLGGQHSWVGDHCGFWGHQYCQFCRERKYPEIPGRCSECIELMQITESDYLRQQPENTNDTQ